MKRASAFGIVQGSRFFASSCHSHYDIVISGGGLVGSALAAGIGASKSLSSKKILLLDSASKFPSLPSQPPAHYGNRVSAISPISLHFFHELGIWERVLSYRAKKVTQLKVFDSSSYSSINFDRSKGLDIAYIVENEAIVAALAERVGDFPNITVCASSTVLPDDDSEMESIVLKNGDRINTHLVVGADGASSRVRSSLGEKETSWKYPLVVDAKGDNSVAYQLFSPTGPIALLPLTKSLSSLVWTTSPEETTRLLALSPDSFVDELLHALQTEADQNAVVNQCLSSLFGHDESLEERLPSVLSLQVDNRASFPLSFSHSHSYIGRRCALVGDAAHRVHPLAGQGVNLGWRDCQVLTAVLEKACKTGADLGSITALRSYDSAAQHFNVPVMVGIDWLNRLYSTRVTPVVFARALGLSAVNAIHPLKKFLVDTLSNPLPKAVLLLLETPMLQQACSQYPRCDILMCCQQIIIIEPLSATRHILPSSQSVWPE